MKVEVRVVGWDERCSFSMFGHLGSDAFGRFVSSNNEKFYFPDDAIVYARAIPAEPPAAVQEQPKVLPEKEKPVEVEQPAAPMGKPSRAHELAVLARKLREKNLKKVEKEAKKVLANEPKKKEGRKSSRPPTLAEAPLTNKKSKKSVDYSDVPTTEV
jgi:hypothetical protein